MSILRDNARTPTAEIARALHLSRSAVQQRIQRLVADRVIRGFTVVLDESASDSGVRALVLVQMSSQEQDCFALADDLRGWPEIFECHSVAGTEDAALVVRVPTMEDLSDLLHRISKLARVHHVRSHVILSTIFSR